MIGNPMALEIYDHIFIGGQADARMWNSTLICVMNRRPIDLNPAAHWVSVTDEQGKFSGAKLTAAAQLIYILRDDISALKFGVSEPKWTDHDDFTRPPLAHIMIQDEFGQLQAPMVLAWYLHTKKRMEFPAIYQLFKDKGHPFGN